MFSPNVFCPFTLLKMYVLHSFYILQCNKHYISSIWYLSMIATLNHICGNILHCNKYYISSIRYLSMIATLIHICGKVRHTVFLKDSGILSLFCADTHCLMCLKVLWGPEVVFYTFYSPLSTSYSVFPIFAP